jgi:hypothetical protein
MAVADAGMPGAGAAANAVAVAVLRPPGASTTAVLPGALPR